MQLPPDVIATGATLRMGSCEISAMTKNGAVGLATTCCLVDGCVADEIEQLKSENAQLKSRVDALTVAVNALAG